MMQPSVAKLSGPGNPQHYKVSLPNLSDPAHERIYNQCKSWIRGV